MINPNDKKYCFIKKVKNKQNKIVLKRKKTRLYKQIVTLTAS